MKTPVLTRFGNPVLRSQARQLPADEITSAAVKQLVASMRALLRSEQYGVGLAAPQIGESLAVAVIDIHPTPLRPEVERYQQVLINPAYTGVGRRAGAWEGCMSSGTGDDILYGKALRYKTIEARWQDETGASHQEILTGLPAHVFQHETDHLNGILFVDRVRDKRTFMMADEYRARVVTAAKRA